MLNRRADPRIWTDGYVTSRVFGACSSYATKFHIRLAAPAKSEVWIVASSCDSHMRQVDALYQVPASQVCSQWRDLSSRWMHRLRKLDSRTTRVGAGKCHMHRCSSLRRKKAEHNCKRQCNSFNTALQHFD